MIIEMTGMPTLQVLRILLKTEEVVVRRFERHENVNVSTLEEANLRTHPKIILQRKPSIRSGAFGVYSAGEPPRIDFFTSQTRRGRDLAPSHRQIRPSSAGREPGLNQVSKITIDY